MWYNLPPIIHRMFKLGRRTIMKFISWNIDSLNAALTSDSSRAVLTRKDLKVVYDYTGYITMPQLILDFTNLNTLYKDEEKY